jgi:uncharacterized membrane protein
MEILMDSYLWRFLHIFFGIIWIGTLYYFNFMQTPFFGETDANTKSGAIQKLLPRALWWFRYGALMTFLTGLVLLQFRWLPPNASLTEVWSAPGGLIIYTGVLLGITMFLNVWLVIWPNQKIVMASTNAVLGGGKADPAAAAAGARAGVASRTNTLFSIPLLFFMGAAAHFPLQAEPENKLYWAAVGAILAIYAFFEWNAVKGKMIKPLATVKAVITSGFVLLVVFYALIRSVSHL